MASPIYIRIYNYTNTALTTKVTEQRDLEDAGANFNNITINGGTAYESDTKVKTGAGNGELTISLYQGSVLIGYFKMKDLKNPHEGLNSIEVPDPSGAYQFTSVAYRHLPNEPEDNRYIYLAVNTYPSGSSLP
ncbi:MAG TPA: hypothetical protein VJH03_12500 [Blastocatellia bacterium]|nr:hypothetical protein [Blastocatellia bacterium]